ncbi:MAG TPA: acyl-CoA dehydrogenase family protein, partial [Pseudonocardiaceae bacterium]|nr:acyl-CoA dehydrogenase family protein [Pseudonocardiaceae bacterium]
MPFQGFDLPDELRLLSGTVAEFVREEIRPVEARLPGDARDLPDADRRELQRKARDAGFWCLEAPVEFGGGGLSVFEGIVLTEQMAKHRYSFPS